MKRWLRQVEGCQTDALPLHRASVKRYKAAAAADSDAVLCNSDDDGTEDEDDADSNASKSSQVTFVY